LITSRRGLISNSKYQHQNVNIDDDYNEVWGRGNRVGLMNFVNKNNQIMNNYDYKPIQNLNNYEITRPNGMQRSLSGHPGRYVNNNQPIYPNNYPSDDTFINMQSNHNIIDNQNFNYDNTLPNGINNQLYNTSMNNHTNSVDINLTYKNIDADDENRKKKEDYGRSLLNQMEEKKRIFSLN
jgi:hypothetical protein